MAYADRAQVVVEGIGSIRHRLRNREKQYMKVIRPALQAAGEFILEKSREYVPIRTKFLYNSGRVEVTGKRWDMSVYIRYEAPYAVFVHEDLNARHAPGRTAKFLERAIYENEDLIRAIIRNRSREGL